MEGGKKTAPGKQLYKASRESQKKYLQTKRQKLTCAETVTPNGRWLEKTRETGNLKDDNGAGSVVATTSSLTAL